jgi:hypothetical protein
MSARAGSQFLDRHVTMGFGMLLECSNCEAIVDAKEVAQHKYIDPIKWEEDDGTEGEYPFDARVVLVSCPKCNHPMLAYDDEGTEGEFVRIYPPRDRNLHPSVPEPIRNAFTEARTCFRAKAFVAAAIMCRKTLEGICLAHGAKSRSLAAALKELKEKGIIENRLFEWAEELRAIGNEAAHGVQFIAKREDAEDALQFTEALIEYVFTYRDRFEEFKKRRAKNPTPSKEEQVDSEKSEAP